MIMSKHFNGQLIKKVNTSSKVLGKSRKIELKNYGRIRVHRTYSIAKSNLGIIENRDYVFSEKLEWNDRPIRLYFAQEERKF